MSAEVDHVMIKTENPRRSNVVSGRLLESSSMKVHRLVFSPNPFSEWIMRQSISKKRTTRQRPISCHFCRSRKLRCSRHFPCPNCETRGLKCQLYTSQSLPTSSRPSHRGISSDFNSEVLARLQRLEEIVLPPRHENSGPRVESPQETDLVESGSGTNDSELLERECLQQVSSVSLETW